MPVEAAARTSMSLSSGAESVLPGRWAWAGVGPVPKSLGLELFKCFLHLACKVAR